MSNVTNSIKHSKSGPWLGIALTHKGGKPISDKWAISYASRKFGVPKDQIEWKRTGGCILVRQKVESDEVGFLSFEQFKRWVYGTPTENDPHYNAYRQFGYGVWLMRAYPDEWGTGDQSELVTELRQDYDWYRLEYYLDANLEDDLSTLERFLHGKALFELTVPDDDVRHAVHIWSESNGREFVILACADGSIYPTVLPADHLQETGRKFKAFDDWLDS